MPVIKVTRTHHIQWRRVLVAANVVVVEVSPKDVELLPSEKQRHGNGLVKLRSPTSANDNGLHTAAVGAGGADTVQLLPSAVQRYGCSAEAVFLPALFLPEMRQPGAHEGHRALLRALLEAN